MSQSTRDWLLDKLLKLRVALAEVKQDYEARLAKTVEERDSAIRRAESAREDFMEAHSRMIEMAPQKQFKVVFQRSCGDTQPLGILCVSSSNGCTTITVERA